MGFPGLENKGMGFPRSKTKETTEVKSGQEKPEHYQTKKNVNWKTQEVMGGQQSRAIYYKMVLRQLVNG